MHELSLAMEVGRLVEEQLRASPGRLLRVGVVVGDDSGVEPENFAFCLEAVLAHPPFDGAEPVLNRVPGDALRLDFLEVDDGGPDDRGP
ncbi:MAG TPA: hydrogenase maturation nickel metallochaperone HypA [Gemmatimonadales bacterium]|nr:hydrogenase maturation nickel metallochaperone HypA [Gemmatimonadales bacterium]